jgi:hypothetical protein
MYMIHTVLNDYNKKYNGTRKRTNTLGCLKEMNKISIDNTNIALDDSIRLLVAYTKRFDVILNIKFGEKIGRDDDNIYYVFNNGYFQQMTRWWYSENRFKTCDYIQQDLDEFTRYLEGYYNNILMSDGFKYDKINDGATFKKVATFNEELNNFIKQLVTGIYTLKQTYGETIETAYIFGTKEGDEKAKEIVSYIDHKITRMLYYKNLFLQIFNK